MDESFSGSGELASNMHVDLGDLPGEISEAMLAQLKPAARGLLIRRLEMVWAACEPFIADGQGTGADLRMVELALKTVDRLTKLLEVTQVDRAGVDDQPDLVGAAVRRDLVLRELEDRSGFLRAG